MLHDPARAQVVVMSDPIDAAPRLTDIGHNGQYVHAGLVLPDLIEMRLGTFEPAAPHVNRFEGAFLSSGRYMRFDAVFQGLLNPPGPVNRDPENLEYVPLRYGPSPLCAYFEFDMDNDPATGGELDFPEIRYNGMAGMFGGHPVGARFEDRIARDTFDLDHWFESSPFVDRSGEEFHLAVFDEYVDTRLVLVEKPGGNPAIFEAGEIWILSGPLLHRAHGFEEFSEGCNGAEGTYKPPVQLRWSHDSNSNQTTISMVYPITNAGSAAFISAQEPVEPNDHCVRNMLEYSTENQNSIEEALVELKFSAGLFKDNPEFEIISGWEDNNVSDCLDPTAYGVTAVLATCYSPYQDDENATYVWTDIWPNVRPGDFSGDGCVELSDPNILSDYIEQRDGSAYDFDGVRDGNVTLSPVVGSFCLYDENVSCVVNLQDRVILGDMDLNQLVNVNDIAPLVEALLNPTLYPPAHGGVQAWVHGDLNCDGRADALDIQGFVDLLGIH